MLSILKTITRERGGMLRGGLGTYAGGWSPMAGFHATKPMGGRGAARGVARNRGLEVECAPVPVRLHATVASCRNHHRLCTFSLRIAGEGIAVARTGNQASVHH